MNENTRTAFSIASYTNDLFVRKLKSDPDDIVHEKLDNVVSLFLCLVNRDVFLKKYGE